SRIPGASLFLQASQDLRIGGRSSSSQYQYTLKGDDLDELSLWSNRLVREVRNIEGLTGVTTDQYNKGLQTKLTVDRDTAARLGIDMSTIDNTLYDAFGQRQVSTIYKSLNQYHVVMQVEPEFSQNPDALRQIFIPVNGSQIPLKALYQQTSANSAL